jgi:hypothetical protein
MGNELDNHWVLLVGRDGRRPDAKTRARLRQLIDRLQVAVLAVDVRATALPRCLPALDRFVPRQKEEA